MLSDRLDFFPFWLEYFIHLESTVVTHVSTNQMVQFASGTVYQGDEAITEQSMTTEFPSILKQIFCSLRSIFKENLEKKFK